MLDHEAWRLVIFLVALLVWRIDERRARNRDRKIERAWVEEIEHRTYIVHDAALQVLDRHGQIMLEGLNMIVKIGEKFVHKPASETPGETKEKEESPRSGVGPC